MTFWDGFAIGIGVTVIFFYIIFMMIVVEFPMWLDRTIWEIKRKWRGK